MQVINLTNKKLISSCSSAVNGGNGNTNSVEGKWAVWGIQNISIMSRTLLQGMMNNVQRLGLRHFDWRLSSSKWGEHRYWWVEISQWKSFNTCNSLYDIYLRHLFTKFMASSSFYNQYLVTFLLKHFINILFPLLHQRSKLHHRDVLSSHSTKK